MAYFLPLLFQTVIYLYYVDLFILRMHNTHLQTCSVY